jgi:hypothetical protein
MPMRSQYNEYHRSQDAALAAARPYPDEKFNGRGIVICAGGPRYFTCAWALLRVLARSSAANCRLRCGTWAQRKWTRACELAGRGLSADVVDACVVPGVPPPDNGWPLKPFAILHSRFREVILIDADTCAGPCATVRDLAVRCVRRAVLGGYRAPGSGFAHLEYSPPRISERARFRVWSKSFWISHGAGERSP